MEFLRVVEDELRGLAGEARRRYPVVQEAAERAILKLRNLREEYVVALRRNHAGKAPPLSMFRSQDLLRPFLLACNHGDASPHLMIMAMGSIQYLINRDAILPSDAPNILRVLGIQSQSKDADVQKRVLQTMVMVVTWKSCEMSEDTVAQALGVCLGLHAAKNATVRTAADMTVRQIISLLFDRVAEELGVVPGQTCSAPALASSDAPDAAAGEGTDQGVGALRCAHLVFQDLCVLSRGEQGQWIKRTSVSPTLGLELVEQVLSQQPLLFRNFEVLRRLLSQEVSPLILQTLRRRMTFPLLVRLLRAASTVAVTYGDLLPDEAQAILSAMLASLGNGASTDAGEGPGGEGTIIFTTAEDTSSSGRGSWSAILTLQAVHRVLSRPLMVVELFRHNESGKAGATIVQDILRAVSQYLRRHLSTQHSGHALDSMVQSIRSGRGESWLLSAAEKREARKLPVPDSLAAALARDMPASPDGDGTSSGPNTPVKGSRSTTTAGRATGSSGAKSSSTELLHETEEPNLEEAEVLLWALQCTVDFASVVSSLVEQEFALSDTTIVIPSSSCLAPDEDLPDNSLRGSLRLMCEILWEPLLGSLSHVLLHCSDPLVVAPIMGGYKDLAVAAGVLGVEIAADGFIGRLCRCSLPQWHGSEYAPGAVGGSAAGGGHGATTGQSGASGSLSWNNVGALESTLQVAHRLGNVLRGTWHVVLDTLEQATTLLVRRAIAKPMWSPHSPETELEEVELHCARALEAVERLVEFSTTLEDRALYTLMSSLQALAVVGLANTATVLPQERSTPRGATHSNLNGSVPNTGAAAGGAGAAAVAAASGLVSLVGAATRGVGAAMFEGRDAVNNTNRDGPRDRDPRNGSAKSQTTAGDSRAHTPWVSSRLVVDCAAANTWRLSVVWELVSGHLRVVAKAREAPTRDYAVRALRELIVDGVQRIHPNMRGSFATSAGGVSEGGSVTPLASGSPSSHRATTPRASRARASTAAPPLRKASSGGDEGFMPNLLGLRGRFDGGDGERESFRWMFHSDVSYVFLATEAGNGFDRETAGDGAFEAVLFETMGLFALTPHVDTREAMLQTLYTILQSCGQVLDSAWAVILNLLHSVAKGATDASCLTTSANQNDDHDRDEATQPEQHSQDATAAAAPDERPSGDGPAMGEAKVVTWGGACLGLAFKCLQLIVDDFMERFPPAQVARLITCVGAFGAQTESVNLSLTAIGMLWSVCDTFADRKSRDPQRQPSQGTESPVRPDLEGDRSLLRSMWRTMLLQLRSLAVDVRPELRNCAVNTLFSAAVGNGLGLSEADWKQFLLEVTFPLMHQVLEATNSASKGANTAVAPELKKGVRMLMHHTRDTDQKQWNETRVLAMQGLGRVLRAFVAHLARWDWFSGEGGVWATSLELYRDACLLGSESQEVALAGIDGITTLVLLVGRTGFSSVQVRAGTGMKIVNGTLQRLPTLPSSNNASKSGKPSSAKAGAAAALGGTGGAARAGASASRSSTNAQFTTMRPSLYSMAWEAMVEASRFEADESGDVAPAFVQGLTAVYKAGLEDGAELCPGQEGEEKRTQQLFRVLDSLFLPRVPSPSPDGAIVSTDTPPRRPVYLPKVSAGQRAILDFLQEDLRSGWPLALRLLAKYSVAGAEACGDVSSAGGVVMEGTSNAAGVTKECGKEAKAVLSAMMSGKLRAPERDRTLALEGLLAEVSGPCMARLEALRKGRRWRCQSPPEADELMSSFNADTEGKRSSLNATGVSSTVHWPSLDSYAEVMRILLVLLFDGLARVPSSKAAFQASERSPHALQAAQSSQFVRTYAAAVRAVAIVSEGHQWGLVISRRSAQRQRDTSAPEPEPAPAREENSNDDSVNAFPELLGKALTFLTDAVLEEIVPLVGQDQGSPRRVIRDLIDTLGAVACPSPKAAPTALEGGGPRREIFISRTAHAQCNGSRACHAYGRAVTQLRAISGGEKTERRDWTKLGFTLRRRALWHLVRCTWSAARAFRDLEDAWEGSQEGRSNGGTVGVSESELNHSSRRCTLALMANEKLTLPPALITPRFKKLLATKQAQETEQAPETLTSVARSPLPAAEASNASDVKAETAFVEGGDDDALAGDDCEDAEWASMAEDEGDDTEEGNRNDKGDEIGRGHLMLLCRVLLRCVSSRDERVQKEAAFLLAEADIPRELEALQDQVSALKRELRRRDTRLTQAEREVGDLRAQVAAGAFMI